MAINFEAANMAGYNNPKIEVYKAIINFETNAITEAPSKPEIIRCLHRGSIPAMMCTSSNGDTVYLLWVSTWGSDNTGDTIMFSSSTLTILYDSSSDSPVVATG